MATVIRRLNETQTDVVAHYTALNVPLTWFIGPERDDGSVEVIGLGETFVWSLLIQENGDHSTSECQLDPEGFSTGIEV
jgi:hypothetical protein